MLLLGGEEDMDRKKQLQGRHRVAWPPYVPMEQELNTQQLRIRELICRLIAYTRATTNDGALIIVDRSKGRYLFVS